MDQTLHLKVVNKTALRSKFLGATSFLVGSFMNPEQLGVAKKYARKLGDSSEILTFLQVFGVKDFLFSIFLHLLSNKACEAGKGKTTMLLAN